MGFEASTASSQPAGGLRETALEVPFSPPLKARVREPFERSLFFVSERLRAFELDCDADGNIRGVKATVQGEIADCADKIRLLAEQLRTFRGTTAREVWRSASSRAVQDRSADLVRVGWLHLPATGLATLSGPLLQLFDYLDRRIANAVHREFGAVEHRYPTLVPAEEIISTHYLENFPHLLFFVTRLHGDIATYAAHAERAKQSRADLDWVLAGCSGAQYCLPPTMCFHTYHQARHAKVAAPGIAVTARGKSFRFESRYQIGLERLFDFTIRETVFLGERAFVRDCRARMLALLSSLIDELGLAACGRLANDPFFANPQTGALAASQHVLEQKIELCMPVAPDREIAVGSLNIHGDFFGQNFDIKCAGDAVAETSCTGIGLERLTYAFVCQHGVDPANWPAPVRQALNAGEP
jgi:hypothetical protein